MLIETETTASGLVVRVARSRLDASVAVEFKAKALQAVEGATPPVRIDLGEVEFIDSSGLGALVGVLKHCGGAGSVELVGLTGPVRKVFDLTRMTAVFRIRDAAPEGR